MTTASYELTGTIVTVVTVEPVSEVKFWSRYDIGAGLPTEFTAAGGVLACSDSSVVTLLHTDATEQGIVLMPGNGEAGLVFGLQNNGDHHRVTFRSNELVLERSLAGAVSVLDTTEMVFSLTSGFFIKRDGLEISVNGDVEITLSDQPPTGRWGYYLLPGNQTRLGPVASSATIATEVYEGTASPSPGAISASSPQTDYSSWVTPFTLTADEIGIGMSAASLDGKIQFVLDEDEFATKPTSPVRLFWLDPGLVPPAAPTGFGASEITISSITWTWTNTGTHATGFVLLDENDDTVETLGSVGSFAESGLVPGTSYTRQLVATNAAGSSPAALVTISTASGAPGEIEGAVAFMAHESALSVYWEPLDGATELEVRSATGELIAELNMATGSGSFTSIGRSTIKLAATNGYGAGATLTIPVLSVVENNLEAPTLSTQQMPPYSVLYSWRSSVVNAGIRIYDADHVVRATLSASAQQWQEEGLATGVPIIRYARAIVNGEESPASEPIIVILPTPPAQQNVAPTGDGDLVPVFVSGVGAEDDGLLTGIDLTGPQPLEANVFLVGSKPVDVEVYTETDFKFRYAAMADFAYETLTGQAEIQIRRYDNNYNMLAEETVIVNVSESGTEVVDPIPHVGTPGPYGVKWLSGTANSAVRFVGTEPTSPGSSQTGDGFLVGSVNIEVITTERVTTQPRFYKSDWYDGQVNADDIQTNTKSIISLVVPLVAQSPVFWAETRPAVFTGNFLTNGDIEIGTTGFAAKNNATISREIDYPYEGDGYLKVVCPGDEGDHGVLTVDTTTSGVVEFSPVFRMKDETRTMRVGIRQNSNGAVLASKTVTANERWQRVTVTHTLGASLAVEGFIDVGEGVTATTEFWVDEVFFGPALFSSFPHIAYQFNNGEVDGDTTDPYDVAEFRSQVRTMGTAEVDWEGSHRQFRFSQAGLYQVLIPAPDYDPLYSGSVTNIAVEVKPNRWTSAIRTNVSAGGTEYTVTLDVTSLQPDHQNWRVSVKPGRIWLHNQPGVLIGDELISPDTAEIAKVGTTELIISAAGTAAAIYTPANTTIVGEGFQFGQGIGAIQTAQGHLTVSATAASSEIVFRDVLSGGSLRLTGLTVDRDLVSGSSVVVQAAADGGAWEIPADIVGTFARLDLKATLTGNALSGNIDKSANYNTSAHWESGSGSDYDTATPGALHLLSEGIYTTSTLDLGASVVSLLEPILSGNNTSAVLVEIAAAIVPSGPWNFVDVADVVPRQFVRIRLTATEETYVSHLSVPYEISGTYYNHPVVKSINLMADRVEAGDFVIRRGKADVLITRDMTDQSVGTLAELLALASVAHNDLTTITYNVAPSDEDVQVTFSQDVNEAVEVRSTLAEAVTSPTAFTLSGTYTGEVGSWVAVMDESGELEILQALDQEELGATPSLVLRYDNIDQTTVEVDVLAQGKWKPVPWTLEGREITIETGLSAKLMKVRYRVLRSAAITPVEEGDQIEVHEVDGTIRIWPGVADVAIPISVHPLSLSEGGYLVLRSEMGSPTSVQITLPELLLQDRWYTGTMQILDATGNPIPNLAVQTEVVGAEVRRTNEHTATDGRLSFLIKASAVNVTLSVESGNLSYQHTILSTSLLAVAKMKLDAPDTTAVNTWVTIDLNWLEPKPIEAGAIPITVAMVGGQVSASETVYAHGEEVLRPTPSGEASTKVRASTPGVYAITATAGSASGAAILVVV
jgi:hypothetical protein